MNKRNSIAGIYIQSGVSIIIPTYKERENIAEIVKRIEGVKDTYDLELEVIFMDDNSCDGSQEVVEHLDRPWVKMVVRTSNRGLSPSVIDGFSIAKYPVLVCMDCDLSHPPEKIPQMILALSTGQELVIGSRYVPGASTDDDWGVFRWLNSRVATLLARPLTTARDPMSGFFVLMKEDFDKAKGLNPIGYKIALEIIVKCGFQNVGEVPIHFTDRIHGESKLSWKEQARYIQHIRRLYMHRFGNAMHLVQFLAVGAIGAVVNLAVLSLGMVLGFTAEVCLQAGIGTSVVSNFLLNRRFTFSYARSQNIIMQFLAFVGQSLIGIVVNYSVALYLRNHVLPDTPISLQLAALVGIASGTIFNFLGNRYIVFRKQYVRTNA